MDQFPDIENLLPHRGNMKLIQDIIAIEKDYGITGASVLPNWPLTNNIDVDCLVSVELVAQTAAITIGYHCLEKNKKSNRIGWIVGVSQAQFRQDSIPIGTYVTVTAHTQVTIENYTKINGYVTLESRRIARVDLQVFGNETQ